MKHLFQVSNELVQSVSVREAMASYADMIEMRISNPPYPEFDLAVPTVDATLKLHFAPVEEHADTLAIFKRYLGEGADVIFDTIGVWLTVNDGPPISWVTAASGVKNEATFKKLLRDVISIYVVFIVLLATRNVVKSTVHNSLAKFGVGKHKADYVTTLSLGEITETDYEAGKPSGRTMRPHMRRGHIRRQKHGPSRSFEKKIFIQPVMVNSDREPEPGDRIAYNVTVPA